MKRGWRDSGGQGTLEYILLIAAILVAVLYGINNYIKKGADSTMKSSGEVITEARKKFSSGMTLK